MKIGGLFSKKDKKTSVSRLTPEQRSQLLLKEYSRVFSLFRNHPFISIKEVIGVPPHQYRVAYGIDGLVQTGKSIESKNEHIVEITLTPDFPGLPPQALMTPPAYHPNISVSSIDLAAIWNESPTLADCIVGIGKMIAYQRYDLEEPLNGEAAQWAMRNKSLLPLSGADLNYKEPVTAPKPARETGEVGPDAANARIVEEDQTKAISVSEDTEGVIPNLPGKTKLIVVQAPGSPKPDSQSKPAPKEETAKPAQSVIAEASAALAPAAVNRLQERKTPVKFEAPRPREPISAQLWSSEPAPAAAAAKPQPESPMVSEVKIEHTAARAPEKTAEPLNLQPETRAVSEVKILTESAAAPVIVSEPSAQAYCPSCGAGNFATSNFCARCGKKLAAPKMRRVTKLFAMTGMIAIPIIILETGFLVIVLNKKQSHPQAVLSNSAQPVEVAQPKPEPKAEIQAPKEEQKKTASPEEKSAAAAPEKTAKAKQAETAPKSSEQPATAAAAASSPEQAEPDSRLQTIEAKPGLKKKKKEKQETEENAVLKLTQPEPAAPAARGSSGGITDNLKLGKLYLGIGSADDAIKRFSDVLAIDPANKEAQEGLEQARKMKNR